MDQSPFIQAEETFPLMARAIPRCGLAMPDSDSPITATQPTSPTQTYEMHTAEYRSLQLPEPSLPTPGQQDAASASFQSGQVSIPSPATTKTSQTQQPERVGSNTNAFPKRQRSASRTPRIHSGEDPAQNASNTLVSDRLARAGQALESASDSAMRSGAETPTKEARAPGQPAAKIPSTPVLLTSKPGNAAPAHANTPAPPPQLTSAVVRPAAPHQSSPTTRGLVHTRTQTAQAANLFTVHQAPTRQTSPELAAVDASGRSIRIIRKKGCACGK